MFAYLVAGLVGAIAAHRTMPVTKVKKLDCIGPKSGLQYNVEVFQGTSFIVVRCDGSGATLQKNANKPGYHLITILPESSPQIIERIKADFINA